MEEPGFSGLFSALFSCFIIIFIGYIAGRLNIITSSQSHGIGNFVGTFALPALLFKSMVELNFQTVSWSFMLAIFLSKACLFLIIIVIAMFLLQKNGIGKSGLYAIFATQSNDFALGYPIVKVLYKDNFPELLQYIYLLAPISLVILNPIGMLLMEIDKQLKNKEAAKLKTNSDETEPSNMCDSCPSTDICTQQESSSKVVNEEQRGLCRLLLKALLQLLLNPIVFMVFIGLAFHFIFNGKIPSLLQPFLSTLSNAFSASALFYLGLSMVGKIGEHRGVKLILPASLIVAKILVLPILARLLLYGFNNILPITSPHSKLTDDISNNTTQFGNMSYLSTLANFAFLYGTFPTAPSVLIYAAKYGLEVDRIATAMVVCTTLSAPIMYISGWTLTISMMDYKFYYNEIGVIAKDVSVVGIIFSVCCIFIFIFSKKFQRIPHLLTLVLTISMFWSSFMSVIWGFVINDSTPIPNKIASFFFLFTGIEASRLYTAALAIFIVVIKYYGNVKARKLQWFFIAVPISLSLIISIVVVSQEIQKTTFSDTVFMFGMTQEVVTFAILILSLIVCVISLIFLFRIPGLSNHGTSRFNYAAISSQNSDADREITSNTNNNEDSLSISSISSKEVNDGWFQYSSGDPQIGRHVFLLLILSVSMLIGIVLSFWRLFNYDQSGIYFEIAFLDAVFNFGQAFFVFLIFGFDEELLLDPLMQVWYRLRGSSQAILPPFSEVDQEILRQCHVFVKHHLENCQKALLCNRQYGLSSYNNVITGTDFCTWLVEMGLASDRTEAVQYGQNLLKARLLHHVTKRRNFYDKNFLYQFEKRTQESKDIAKNISSSQDNSSVQSGTLQKCFLRKQYSYEAYLKNIDGVPNNHQNNITSSQESSLSFDRSDLIPTSSNQVNGSFQSSRNEEGTSGNRNIQKLTDW